MDATPAHNTAISRTAPLSFGQEQWWLANLINPEFSGHNIVFPVRLRGSLNIDHLQRVYDELRKRHEILRTTFYAVEHLPIQTVHPWTPLPMEIIDLRHLPENERQAEAIRLSHEDAQQPLDLKRGPIFRAKVIRLGEEDHVWLRTLHHIACDGWSVRLLLKEIAALYEGMVEDKEPDLPPPGLQSCDFALSQHDDTVRWHNDIQFWKEHIGGIPPELEMLRYRALPPDPKHTRGIHPFDLEPEFQKELAEISSSHGATLFMTLMTAFAVLIGRLGEQDHLIVSTPIAMRSRPDLRNAIGYYIQTAPLRHDLSGNPTFVEQLHRTRKLMVDAFKHGDVPFRELVKQLNPDRSAQHDALFHAMVVSVPLTGQDRLVGLRHEQWPAEIGGVLFGIMLQIKLPFGVGHEAMHESGLMLSLHHSMDHFPPKEVERIAARFQTLLRDIVANPGQHIQSLTILPEHEHQEILSLSETPQTPGYPPVHELVTQICEQKPQAPAVISEDGSTLWTYADLQRQAAITACVLQDTESAPGKCVALWQQSGAFLYPALLGILQSGAACLPLDAALPAARLRQILEDAAPCAVVAPHDAQAALDQIVPDNLPRVVFGEMGETDVTSIARSIAETDPVYLLYTSGSTGIPKGVALPHKVLSNLVVWQTKQTNGDALRTSQWAPLSFDVSWQEIFSTWATGAALVTVGEDARRDPLRLLQVLREREVERAFLPVVALQQLANAARKVEDHNLPHRLGQVICAGEALVVTPAIREFFTRLQRFVPATLHNHYGPTESHVVTALALSGDPAHWPEKPPIGRPVSGTRVYVVDRCGDLAPIGALGELAIGAEMTADGYQGHSGLSGEKWRETHLGKLYFTGDRARWNENSMLEFLGRRDAQIKIRGYRVEPGEIEAALMRHPAVSSAAVVVRQGAGAIDSGETRLEAHVGAAPGTTESALRMWVRDALPEYMTPASFIIAPQLSMTASGKIDRLELGKPRKDAGKAREESIEFGDFEEGTL